MKPEYTILENGNYLLQLLDENEVPMFIEMTLEEYEANYGQ